MTYRPKPGDKVTIRSWTTASPRPGATRRLHSEQDGTVTYFRPGLIKLEGMLNEAALGAYEREGAEPFERYMITEVDLQPSGLAGRRVRIRCHVQPSLTPGDCARELDLDLEGTVTRVLADGRTVELDPDSAQVHYAHDGHHQAAPLGLAWRKSLDYVFLGGSARDGTCQYLVTEVEVDPEPASSTPLADALAVVDRAQAEVAHNWSRSADEAELGALRELAEAVRTHLLAHPERQS